MDTPTVTDVPRDVPVAMDVGFDAGAPMRLGLRAACADDNTCCAGSCVSPRPPAADVARVARPAAAPGVLRLHALHGRHLCLSSGRARVRLRRRMLRRHPLRLGRVLRGHHLQHRGSTVRNRLLHRPLLHPPEPASRRPPVAPRVSRAAPGVARGSPARAGSASTRTACRSDGRLCGQPRLLLGATAPRAPAARRCFAPSPAVVRRRDSALLRWQPLRRVQALRGLLPERGGSLPDELRLLQPPLRKQPLRHALRRGRRSLRQLQLLLLWVCGRNTCRIRQCIQRFRACRSTAQRPATASASTASATPTDRVSRSLRPALQPASAQARGVVPWTKVVPPSRRRRRERPGAVALRGPPPRGSARRHPLHPRTLLHHGPTEDGEHRAHPSERGPAVHHRAPRRRDAALSPRLTRLQTAPTGVPP